MKLKKLLFLITLIFSVPDVAVYAQQAVTGPYVMAFHGCDSAVTNCMDPRNHRMYLAQSADGASWTMVPGWKPINGSVPDLIQRGNILYIYSPGRLSRYHLDTNIVENLGPGSVSVTGLSGGFVDPSLFLDDQNRLVLFFLPGRGPGGGDPAGCPPGVSSCVHHIDSATEVAGSDGTQFTLDSGDRATVTLQTAGPIRTASDPDIFFDGTGYVLYISHGPSISVWTSPELRGTYSLLTTLPNGLLSDRTGGVPAGYYDAVSMRYWTYSHVNSNGVSIIRRAVHADFSRQLTNTDWTTVISGSSIGLTATTNVESPGFTRLAPLTVGRMTGGGSMLAAVNDRVTHGMVLHCDVAAGPNNLEINWGRANNFHLTMLSLVQCVDDPSIGPDPSPAGFDTLAGTGTGSLNNVAGATVSFLFADAGEPGRNDMATITVKDPNGVTVLAVSGHLNSGNQQARSR